jgi:rhomboid protease GluP
VTFGFLGLTGAVFVLQSLAQAILGFDAVLALGVKANELILTGQLWRLVTPVFIHAGPLHLFVNMYSLFALGPAVERFFGSPRMLALYLISGVSGVIFSLAFNPFPSVGASGAIFGLLGGLATFLYLHRSVFGPAGGMQLRQLVFVGAINLVWSFSPGIDLWGHVGGLLAGMACTACFGPRLVPVLVDGVRPGLSDLRRWPEIAPRVAAATAMLAAAAMAAMALAAT